MAHRELASEFILRQSYYLILHDRFMPPHCLTGDRTQLSGAHDSQALEKCRFLVPNYEMPRANGVLAVTSVVSAPDRSGLRTPVSGLDSRDSDS